LAERAPENHRESTTVIIMANDSLLFLKKYRDKRKIKTEERMVARLGRVFKKSWIGQRARTGRRNRSRLTRNDRK